MLGLGDIFIGLISLIIAAAILNSYIHQWRRDRRKRFLVRLKDGGSLVVGENVFRALKRAGVVERTTIL